jgi:hypothetical protein
MTKKRFDFLKSNNLGDLVEQDVVIQNVNQLLNALFIPIDNENQTMIDRERLKTFNINYDEPINWSSLNCINAEIFENGDFLITIEEASPNECPTLCEYIQTYMKYWGWNCQVKTEW